MFNLNEKVSEIETTDCSVVNPCEMDNVSDPTAVKLDKVVNLNINNWISCVEMLMNDSMIKWKIRTVPL